MTDQENEIKCHHAICAYGLLPAETLSMEGSLTRFKTSLHRVNLKEN
jgi:hypothetical protein